MKNIFTVFVFASLTLTLFYCKKESDSPSSHEPIVNHVFGLTNTSRFNQLHNYKKTYNMLTMMPVSSSGTMLTLNFIQPMPPDSSEIVGWLQLPNDGYYTIKVYATDGSYLKWDNYLMKRNATTLFTIITYPDCPNYGATMGFMSLAMETSYNSTSYKNTSYHIFDDSTSTWCDKNL